MRRSVLQSFVLVATLVQMSACEHVTLAETADLVAVGQIEALGSEVMDDWGLNVQFTGRLRIIRVLSGTLPSSVLPIRYIAHTPYDADHEFQLRLRRSEDGIWLVCRHAGGRGYNCD